MAQTPEKKTIIKTQQVKIRRSPKYLPFLITGAVIGVIIAVILGLSIPADSKTPEPIVTYLIGYLGALGAVAGIVTAVIVDRIGVARAKTVEATKLES
jgi:membrane associated rhomboid family serine protease